MGCTQCCVHPPCTQAQSRCQPLHTTRLHTNARAQIMDRRGLLHTECHVGSGAPDINQCRTAWQAHAGGHAQKGFEFRPGQAHRACVTLSPFPACHSCQPPLNPSLCCGPHTLSACALSSPSNATDDTLAQPHSPKQQCRCPRHAECSREAVQAQDRACSKPPGCIYADASSGKSSP